MYNIGLMSDFKRVWVSTRIAELGKKKKDLAEALGLPHTRISDIINGNRALKVTEVQPFADFMNMSYMDVINRFSMKNADLNFSYPDQNSDNYDVIEVYRGLSESGKQKFQQLAEEIKKTEED